MFNAENIQRINTKYFESKLIDKYDKAYEEYSRLTNIIINKKNKLQKDDYEIKNTKDTITARFKNSRISFDKPKYVSFYVLQKEVNDEIMLLKHKYDSLKKKILYDTSGDQKDLIGQFESMTAKLNNLYEFRKVIQSVYVLHKNNQKVTMDKIAEDIGNTKDASFIKFSEIETVKNEQDSIRTKSLIQEYLKDRSKKTLIDLTLNKRNHTDFYNLIHEILIKLPSLNGTSSEESVKSLNQSTEKKDPKISKIDKKAKQILKNIQTQEFNTTTYKKKLTKFLFNTLDECKNSKRSKEYYMSKEQIIEVINKDPDLQKKLGKMYKTLSKEELCKKLINDSEIVAEPIDQKISQGNTSDKNDDDDASEMVKKTEFPFNTKDECMSSKRSKLYYMSREDIIKKIENDPSLKMKIGDNYKKMSKDELCNKLVI